MSPASAMQLVPFTAEQLYEACLDVYHDGNHAPYQAWVDTIGDDVVLIRVSYPDEFCERCVSRLEALRVLLHSLHGHDFAITFLVYWQDLERLGIKKRSVALQDLFLPPGV